MNDFMIKNLIEMIEEKPENICYCGKSIIIGDYLCITCREIYD